MGVYTSNCRLLIGKQLVIVKKRKAMRNQPQTKGKKKDIYTFLNVCAFVACMRCSYTSYYLKLYQMTGATIKTAEKSSTPRQAHKRVKLPSNKTFSKFCHATCYGLTPIQGQTTHFLLVLTRVAGWRSFSGGGRDGLLSRHYSGSKVIPLKANLS